jgi:hypothetical protein
MFNSTQPLNNEETFSNVSSDMEEFLTEAKFKFKFFMLTVQNKDHFSIL